MALSRLRSGEVLVLALLLAIAQSLVLLPQVPYYLTYYNPLLGGARAAEEVLMIGQGEGLDQVASWLEHDRTRLSRAALAAQAVPPEAEMAASAEPGASSDASGGSGADSPVRDYLGVASAYPAVLKAHFDGPVKPLPTLENEISDPKFWHQTHRLVFYINQLQRQLPTEAFNTYFTTQPYLYEIQQGGINYARIYPGPTPTEEDLAHIPYEAEVNYGDRVRLRGYNLTTTIGAERDVPLLILYWETLKKLPRQARVVIELRDRQGRVAYRTRDQLVSGLFPAHRLKPNSTLRDAHALQVPEELSGNQYQIYVGWQANQRRRTFGVRNATDGRNQPMAYVGDISI